VATSRERNGAPMVTAAEQERRRARGSLSRGRRVDSSLPLTGRPRCEHRRHRR
jgi:hypothetical protein